MFTADDKSHFFSIFLNSISKPEIELGTFRTHSSDRDHPTKWSYVHKGFFEAFIIKVDIFKDDKFKFKARIEPRTIRIRSSDHDHYTKWSHIHEGFF